MILVEKHNINEYHPYFKECDDLAFKSKNLYNSTLYCVRQSFLFDKFYISYVDLNRKFVQRNKKEYRKLPTKVAKGTMRLVYSNMKSFIALVKKKKKGEYDKPVRLPKYLNKEKGRQVVHYEKDALSFRKKPGYVHLSQTNIFIKSQQDPENIRFVRIVPKGNHYTIEVGYNKKKEKPLDQKKRFVSLDLGVNNLVTLGSNVIEPLIINGRPLKSINQFYNKKIAQAQSELPQGIYISKKINNLYKRRRFKVDDYLHKTTCFLMNHLVSNQIDTVIIGYNSGWKQDVNIGKKNNQNFVYIPFHRLVEMIQYKCEMLGIHCVLQEESYTSKCSFLDNESVEKHDTYLGKRTQRGLFESSKGELINADLNGALNILKKYLQEVWNDQIWLDCIGVSRTPSIKKETITF